MYASELLPPVAGAKTEVLGEVWGERDDDGGGGGGSAASPALALAVRGAYRSACPQVLEVLAGEGLPSIDVLEQVWTVKKCG